MEASVIIKREVFYAIQHGGRIDPKTGRLITPDDKVDEKDNDKVKLSQLTERQRRIVSIIKLDIKVTAEGIKQYFTESLSTINREITALKKAGILAREGGDRNGRWVILYSSSYWRIDVNRSLQPIPILSRHPCSCSPQVIWGRIKGKRGKGKLTSVDGLEGQILGSVYIFIYTALSAPPSRPGKNQFPSSLSFPYSISRLGFARLYVPSSLQIRNVPDKALM